jgi:catechol 2,3-dioxygenase-like lactoylglutathione lyase family enzyme
MLRLSALPFLEGIMSKIFLLLLILTALSFSSISSFGQDSLHDSRDTVASLLIQPSMNVFRRFEGDAEAMNNFYGKALGLQQLMTFNVGGGARVARFQVGDSQVKLSGVVPNRSYHHGKVADATGVRLLTFFFTNQRDLEERFKAQGLDLPAFKPVPGTARSHALVKDPDGQWVELVIVPEKEASACKGIEIGLVVSDLAKSRVFYKDFVGLEELPPEKDALFNTKKYPFRHGSTVVTLRCFGSDLPADTGSGGIQYVVSDAKKVEVMAKDRKIVIDQPLNLLKGFALLTIWLDDPDGITNYFAQVGVKEN